MAAIGTTYTQGTTFGVSNGPTYQGQKTVPPETTGTETYRNYSAQVLNGAADQVVDASGFTVLNWLAMGFKMVVDAVQTGSPTAQQLLDAEITIKLVGALGPGDYEIVLGVGESVSFVDLPVEIDTDVTSITVDGDANVDCDLYGLLLLKA
jgi:hypothetical protein